MGEGEGEGEDEAMRCSRVGNGVAATRGLAPDPVPAVGPAPAPGPGIVVLVAVVAPGAVSALRFRVGVCGEEADERSDLSLSKTDENECDFACSRG